MIRGAYVLLGGLVLGAMGCDGDTTTPVERQWEAELTAEAGFAGVSGAAVVVALPGALQFTALAEIEGDEPGAVRPWHVHFNTCAQGGGIVGTDGAYPRLQVGADGRAEAAVAISEPLDPAASYHVNVHASNADLATIVACGDLVLVSP